MKYKIPLSEFIEDVGLKQRRLAELAGVSEFHLCAILAGRRNATQLERSQILDVLKKYGKAFLKTSQADDEMLFDYRRKGAATA